MEYLIDVLVTDDEEGMRLGVERALKDFTCEFEDLDARALFRVHLAESGEASLAMLKKRPFSLMLLDYKLPGIDGIETLCQATRLNNSMAVVMMTAYASVDTAVEAMKVGAYDFITKPLKRAIVVRSAQRALERRALINEIEPLL